jgi:cephalosporin hydroxylase
MEITKFIGQKTSDLEKYFRNNDKRLIQKWNHYFDIYEHHFSRFRNKEVVILEIGIFQGGSLQMWKDYFGPKAKIYGIDINPKCKDLEEENIKIFIGSQSDRKFLREVKEKNTTG